MVNNGVLAMVIVNVVLIIVMIITFISISICCDRGRIFRGY